MGWKQYGLVVGIESSNSIRLGFLIGELITRWRKYREGSLITVTLVFGVFNKYFKRNCLLCNVSCALPTDEHAGVTVCMYVFKFFT